MKKLISTLTLLFTSLQMFAIGEHGAWDDLNGHKTSSPSVFGLIVGLIAGCFLIGAIFKGKEYSKDDKGCLIPFFVILMIIGVICFMSNN